METKFNFKSQVCTDKNQSERLLALGLKIETADCYHWQETDRYGDGNGKWHCEILSEYNKDHNEYLYNIYGVDGSDEGFFIPAWSLHRLLNLSPESVKQEIPYFTKDGNVELVNRDGIVTKAWGGESLYDALIKFFQWLIKEGYFNKEYLV